jgi:hypothetical protein
VRCVAHPVEKWKAMTNPDVIEFEYRTYKVVARPVEGVWSVSIRTPSRKRTLNRSLTAPDLSDAIDGAKKVIDAAHGFVKRQ